MVIDWGFVWAEAGVWVCAEKAGVRLAEPAASIAI